MSAVYESTLEPAATPQLAMPRKLSYQPALDGVRGLALVIVVIFHLDIGAFPGAYVGVSVFFTLSGFLITSLILDEWHATGDLALRRFYLRRIKRLAPASLITVLAVIVLSALGLVSNSSRLRGDVIAAGFNVFNWREVTGGESYAALFDEESPVAHFWSLAIEEQFYLVWPVAMLLALRYARAGRNRLLALIGVAYIASVIASLLAGPTVVYFATWTRAAEIMAGAMFGVWTATSRRPSWPSWWRYLAAPALAGFVLLAGFSERTTGWAYEGGLGFFALLSVALIAGLQVDGMTTRLLSNRILATLGAASYGLYLAHWPIFVVLTEDRLGVGGISLVGIRIAATLLVGGSLYVGIERPLRVAKRPTRLAVGVLAAIAGSVVVAIAATVLIDRAPQRTAAPTVITAPSATAPEVPGAPLADILDPNTAAPNTAGQQSNSAASDDQATATTAGPRTPTAVAETRPIRLALFGDSIPAWLLRDSVDSFDRDDFVLLNGSAEACDGMVDLPLGRDRRLDELAVPDSCLPWTDTYASVIDAGDRRADIGLLVLGQAPVIDRFVEGEWTHPCDSIDWYLDDVAARVEFLRGEGVEPVIVLPARFGKRATFIVPDDAPERMRCVRTAMAEAADELGVSMIDLDDVLCPSDACDTYRSNDGMHINPESAPTVLDQLLEQVGALPSVSRG